jgi:predicted outer membrane repeat protein
MRKIIIFLGLSLGLFAASATTLCVNNSGQGTGLWYSAYIDLQEAINDANSGDEIWVAEGEYYPNSLINREMPSAEYRSDRHNCFYIIEGKNIKIYGGFPNTGNPGWAERDPKTYITTLSGDIGEDGDNNDNCYQVVTIIQSENIILDGFHITGGNANGSYVYYKILEEDYISYYYLLKNNSGGGIHLASSTVEFNNLEIYDNYASSEGGGLYMVQGNYEDENSSYPYMPCKLSYIFISNSIIRDNTANRGGGIYSEEIPYLELDNTIIQENNANNRGSILGNGGGIYICNYNGSVYNSYLDNVLVADNYATGKGGGIYIDGEIRANLTTSTIAGNTATTMTGQGITCGPYHDNYLIFRGSILAWNGNYNISTHGLAPSSATQISYTRSLVQGYTTTASNCLPGNTNPLFVSVSENNYRLQANSPCIDKGCCGIASTDLDGNPRTFGSSMDMGAYEYGISPNANGVVFVKETGSGEFSGTNWDNAAQLSYALYAAKYDTKIKQIWVAEGVYYPAFSANENNSDSRDIAFVLTNNIQIYGGFPSNPDDNNHTSLSSRDWINNPTILSNPGNYHVLIASSINATLDGLIIEDGHADGDGYISVNGNNIYRNNGGGIYAFGSSLYLRNLIIKNNYASQYGGGIYAYGSYLEIKDVSIMNNYASSGGGIYNYMGDGNIIEDSRICGNIAQQGGSGLHNVQVAWSHLYNVLIVQNEILDSIEEGIDAIGGSIYNEESNCDYFHLTISACIPNGMGIYNVNNTHLSVKNSIIWTAPENIDNTIYGGLSVYDDLAAGIDITYSFVQGITQCYNCLETEDPIFIDYLYNSDYINNPGDYHLQENSPCINFGSFYYTFSDTDLDGNPRILPDGYYPDLGCYEFDSENYLPENKPYHKNKSNEDIINKNIASSDLTLTAYPNPVESGQTIQMILGNNGLYYENPVAVKLYSIEGKQIKENNYPNGNIQWKTSELPAGIYLLVVHTAKGKTYNKKIIIK